MLIAQCIDRSGEKGMAVLREAVFLFLSRRGWIVDKFGNLSTLAGSP